MNPESKWAQINEIVNKVVTFEDKPPTLMQRIDEIHQSSVKTFADSLGIFMK